MATYNLLLLLILIALSLFQIIKAEEVQEESSPKKKVRLVCRYFCESGGGLPKSETYFPQKQCECYYNDCEPILYNYNEIIRVDTKEIQAAKRKEKCIPITDTDKQEASEKEQTVQHQHETQSEDDKPKNDKQDKFDKQCDYFCEKGGATKSEMILVGMKCKCFYDECVHPIEYSHTVFSAISPESIQNNEKLTKCIKKHEDPQTENDASPQQQQKPKHNHDHHKQQLQPDNDDDHHQQHDDDDHHQQHDDDDHHQQHDDHDNNQHHHQHDDHDNHYHHQQHDDHQQQQPTYSQPKEQSSYSNQQDNSNEPNSEQPADPKTQQNAETKLTDEKSCAEFCFFNIFSYSRNEFSAQRKVCKCVDFHDELIFQAYTEDGIPIQSVRESKPLSVSKYKNLYDGEQENTSKKKIITSDYSCTSYCKNPPSTIDRKRTHTPNSYQHSYYAASIETCHCYNTKKNYCDYNQFGIRIRMRDN